ncbi:MAG: hypothetical protein JW806_02280 [Sedimentisphaerales bacterium]|nr:hypothetical protein [Sedimentisphaerales bacterium]
MDAVKKSISVIEPVNEALEKTKILLFRPFNLEKWFIIGFCAWLANLLRGGFYNGTNFNYNRKSDAGAEEVAKIVGFIRENLLVISISASVVIILAISIFILCLWLSSRGRFMFLDCLAKNKAHVKYPWNTFKLHADSLFKFRLLIAILSFTAITALGIPMIAVFFFLKSSTISGVTVFAAFFILFLGIIATGSVIGFIQTLTTDFVVPIMYLHGTNVWAGWQKFMPLLSQHFWKVILYLLFKILIGLCIGAIVMILVILSCCCMCGIGIIFFIIPYVSTVATLPFYSFARLYSLCFFKQFGSEFNVFTVTV